MLEQMGLLDSVKQQLQTALEKNPTDEKLLALRNSLSPYASIAALIDNNKPQVALEAIAAREKEEISRLAYSFWEHRGRKGGWAEGDWKRAEGEFREKPEGRELSILRARAFHCLAKQQASLGKLEDALSSWELALKCRPDAELKSNILAETVSHCQARAAALQQREPETAIGILEMGLELTHDEKLRSLLAEILAQRGITTVNEAQRKREAEKTVDTCEIRNMLEKGQADLKRAAELGSERAKQNLPIASRLIELADSGLLDLSREAWTLFQQANEAANAGDLERAITLLEQAITTAAGKGQAALKSFLAEILAQRSIETFDEVQNKASQEKKITDKMLTDCEAALANLERASQLGCKRATDNLPIGRGVLAEILAQRSIETFNEAQEKAKQREITQQVLTDCRAALANLERASQLGSKRATENLPIARRVLEELRRPPEPPLPEKVARLLEQANQAAAMEDWDTAIAKLRQATKLAGSKPPDVLKKNLAASLANRAVGNANQAVEMMGDAAKAHGPGLSELFKSLQSQGLLRSSDECTFCGKSKYSSHGESWFGYELPDGRKVSLCGKCGSVAQDTFGSAPKPSPEAISLLQSAERDLSEAATLDPSSDHVRKNLSSAREILSKLGPAAPSTSKASRRASGERNNFHAVLVMLILVLACIVILISGEDYRQHGSAMWPNIWVGKLATILAWVIGLPFFLCASTGEINLWWDGLCKKSWKRKGGFAKFMEFLVFMFLISLILTFLAGKLR
jgi:tetratricopeptide (TPR) repeat protein